MDNVQEFRTDKVEISSPPEKQWVIQGAVRCDGQHFMLTNLSDEGIRVKVGGRNFTIAESMKHWAGDSSLEQESIAIMRHMIELAKIRGYVID